MACATRSMLWIPALLVVPAVAYMIWRSSWPEPRAPVETATLPAATEPPLVIPIDPWTVPEQPTDAPLFFRRFETITRAEGLPSDKVTTVLALADAIWVGTDAGAAVRRDGVWTTYGPAEGLAHAHVTSVAHDARNGDVWISTLKGLSRLSGGRFHTYTQLNSGLLNDIVYHVVTHGDLVWAATAIGVCCLDRRTGAWAPYDDESGALPEPWSGALAVGPERLWVAIRGAGIAELDRHAGSWRSYRDPDGDLEIELVRDDGPIHDVTTFVAYAEGVLWQATAFGLSRYDGRGWRSFLASDTGLPGDRLQHVSACGHTAYLASDEGFGVFDGETCVSYKRRDDGRCDVVVWRDGAEVERRTLDTAPADNYVLWAQGGADDVWLGTGRGLSHGIGGAR